MDEQNDDNRPVYVSDLMTADPIVVEPDVALSRVLALMREASIRHVPVIDEEGIVGVVSDRDLTFIHGLPGVSDKVDDSDVEEMLAAPVAVVMKSRFLVERDVVTVAVDTPLKEAIDMLVATRVGAVPVVDDDRQVVGVLSAVDVLRWAADEIL